MINRLVCEYSNIYNNDGWVNLKKKILFFNT
jgi:hypothetical protein